MYRTSRYTAVSALLFVSCLSLTSCGNSLTPPQQVAKAKGEIDKGDYRSALIELSNAAAQDPKAVEPRWLLAQVALKLGDWPRAEKEANRAVELGLSRASAEPLVVEAMLRQGAADRVLAESASLANGMSKAQQATVLGFRGQAFLAQGKLDDAKPVLDQALKIDPDAMAALVGMAVWEGLNGQTDQARSFVERALKVDPSSPQAWSALGELELAQGNSSDAESAFSQAIKLATFPTLARAKRAMARIRLGKFQDAEADVELLKQQGFKDQPYVNYLAGRALFGQKKYPQASAAFKASESGDPSFLPNKLFLATTDLLLGQTEDALRLAEQLYAQAPRSLAAIQLLGAVQVNRSDYDAADRVLQTALKESPGNVAILSMLATTSLYKGDAAKAVEFATKLVSLQPNSQSADDQLMLAKLIAGQKLDAEIHSAGEQADKAGDDYTSEFLLALQAFRDNKVREALERAQALVVQYPDKVDPLKLVGACYLAAGQWDKAKDAFEQALQLKPNEQSAAKALAKIELQQGNAERAKTLLGPLVTQYPNDAEAVLLLADVEERLEGREASIAALQQALGRQPGLLVVRTRLALEYFHGGQPSRVLEVTRDLTPDQLATAPVLLELRGKSQMQTGNAASARTSFERWAQAAPDSAEAHFLYAQSLAEGGDLAGGGEQLARALAIDPKYLPARIGQIKFLVYDNKLDQARTALAELKKDFGDTPKVLGIEGWFALGMRDYANAAKSLSAAFAQKPDTELAVLLARALWGENKPEDAIAVIKTRLQTEPKDLALLTHLALAYLRLGQKVDARATYAKVLELYPNNVEALNNMASLGADQDLEAAISYAERAWQLEPNNPYVLDTLGTLLVKNANSERGSRMITDAAAKLPDDPVVQLHFAHLLVQQKQNPKARAVLDGLIKKAPPDSDQAKEAKALLQSLPAGQ